MPRTIVRVPPPGVVLDEEEIDHEAHDLSWREVLPGGLTRLLADAPDQLLGVVDYQGNAERANRIHIAAGYPLGVIGRVKDWHP